MTKRNTITNELLRNTTKSWHKTFVLNVSVLYTCLTKLIIFKACYAWPCLNFIAIWLVLSSWWHYVNICSHNGLAPKRRQARILTNYDLIYWRTDASLILDELSNSDGGLFPEYFFFRLGHGKATPSDTVMCDAGLICDLNKTLKVDEKLHHANSSIFNQSPKP